MGSTCCQINKCPTHTSQKIEKICMCQTCLEPLCRICVQTHRNLHIKLGYPPKIVEYDQIVDSVKNYQQKMKEISINQQAKLQLLPKSMYIKQLTNEYFAQRNKSNNSTFGNGVRIEGLLNDLELWSAMKEKPQIKASFEQFLKQHLKPNKDVTGKNYTHLYQ